MKVEFRLQPYLYKYYKRRWDVETNMVRTSVVGMLAFGQIKNRNRNSRDNIKGLTKSVWLCSTTEIKFRNSIKRPRKFAIGGFNANIRNLFYDEYFVYMDTCLELDDYTPKTEHTRGFMDKYDLSEDDVSSQTLLRNYTRYLIKKANAK